MQNRHMALISSTACSSYGWCCFSAYTLRKSVLQFAPIMILSSGYLTSRMLSASLPDGGLRHSKWSLTPFIALELSIRLLAHGPKYPQVGKTAIQWPTTNWSSQSSPYRKMRGKSTSNPKTSSTTGMILELKPPIRDYPLYVQL